VVVLKSLKIEEKGSDVNLATRLLIDAFDKAFDAAVVITNDSDLAEPIRQVRRKFGYRVMILHSCSRPGRGPSISLRKAVGILSIMFLTGSKTQLQFVGLLQSAAAI
jgi:NYN domain